MRTRGSGFMDPRWWHAARRGAEPCVAEGEAARRLSGSALAAALRDSRARLWACVDDLDDAHWRVPRQEGLNPIAWELAHVAWFGEFWILRGPHRVDADGRVHAAHEARLAGPDALFDSSRLAHADRWRVELPARRDLRARLDAQLDACLAALPAGEDDAALYFHRLALFHEDMHGEALAWLRDTLGHAPPPWADGPPPCAPPGAATLLIDGGEATLGRPPGRAGFSFDNERPGRTVVLAPFEIDAAPLDAGRFRDFVEDDGYARPALWPGAAGTWLAASGRRHPERWRPAPGSPERWEVRRFDRWEPLDPRRPVVHVNAHEAAAYCRWAGRRLPGAAEWELAARHAGFAWGHRVWEWTADDFLPYPGFVPGPYRDYSQPWFGSHRELRGGAFASAERMHHPAFRNFFLPGRADVFAGLRTAGPAA
jgi:ergothioneine biosynthesis protein EgtB